MAEILHNWAGLIAFHYISLQCHICDWSSHQRVVCCLCQLSPPPVLLMAAHLHILQSPLLINFKQFWNTPQSQVVKGNRIMLKKWFWTLDWFVMIKKLTGTATPATSTFWFWIQCDFIFVWYRVDFVRLFFINLNQSLQISLSIQWTTHISKNTLCKWGKGLWNSHIFPCTGFKELYFVLTSKLYQHMHAC